MSIIHELTERAHRQSAGKGFHDYQPADQRAETALNAEVVALIHSEASEALEAMRKEISAVGNDYDRESKLREAKIKDVQALDQKLAELHHKHDQLSKAAALLEVMIPPWDTQRQENVLTNHPAPTRQATPYNISFNPAEATQ